MPASRCRRTGRLSVSAVAYVARRCAVCSIGKPVTGSGAAGGIGRRGGGRRPEGWPVRDVFRAGVRWPSGVFSLDPEQSWRRVGPGSLGHPLPLGGSQGMEDEMVGHWENAEARPLPIHELGERYRRYRLTDPSAETAMAWSLSRYGQLAPVTACRREGRAELLDGFKRRGGAAPGSLAAPRRRVVGLR